MQSHCPQFHLLSHLYPLAAAPVLYPVSSGDTPCCSRWATLPTLPPVVKHFLCFTRLRLVGLQLCLSRAPLRGGRCGSQVDKLDGQGSSSANALAWLQQAIQKVLPPLPASPPCLCVPFLTLQPVSWLFASSIRHPDSPTRCSGPSNSIAPPCPGAEA